jgi:hypothetical protein
MEILCTPFVHLLNPETKKWLLIRRSMATELRTLHSALMMLLEFTTKQLKEEQKE